MTATWPGTLPQSVLRAGYEESPRMANVEFESDTGPAIERPKGTIKLTDLQVTMIMTTAQVATFEAFVFNTIGQATLSFFFPHPRLLSTVKVRLKGRPPYQVSEVGAPGFWKVAFVMLVIG